MATTVASRKQKGRALQQALVDLLLKAFPSLSEADIRSVPGSVPGNDLWLSEAAKRCLNVDDFECKNQEKISLWACLNQLEKRNDCTSTHLALIFKRNRSRIWATIPIEFFIELLQRANNATINQ